MATPLPAIPNKADRARSDKQLPRIQHFKVLKALGSGSYGKVYKVQRESDDQSYALKETELGSLSHGERTDAVNEVRLLVSINHPNVIRYHEAFLNGSKLCVVMEYAPFGDLRYYITKANRLQQPFPEEAIWRIFLQLCKGLAALHASQIIHRDIKPANLFLCANDLLKIGDLGVAKALNRLQFTRTSIGTPIYMAPEVWAERPYDVRCDMWSVGCVLYEMMTFAAPFGGRTMAELGMRVRSGRYTPIQAGTYSPELIAFAHGLLNLDPKKRPTAEQVLAHPSAARWMRVLPTPPPSLRRPSEQGSNNNPSSNNPSSNAVAALRGGPPLSGSGSLMDTIVVPKDLRHLARVLPPPSYDSDLDSVQDQQPEAAAQQRVLLPPARSASPQPHAFAAHQHQQQQQPFQRAAAPQPQRSASPGVPLAYFPPSSPQRVRSNSNPALQAPHGLRPDSPLQQQQQQQQRGVVLPRLSSPGMMNGMPLLANRPPLPRLSEPGNGAAVPAVAAGGRGVAPIVAHPRPRSAVLEHRPRPVSALPVVRASADHAPLAAAAAAAAGLSPLLSPPLVRPPPRRASYC